MVLLLLLISRIAHLARIKRRCVIMNLETCPRSKGLLHYVPSSFNYSLKEALDKLSKENPECVRKTK